MNKFEEQHLDAYPALTACGIIYIPLGALEWHERHLPFGTDGIMSEYLAHEASRVTGGTVIPTLHFGTDREHDVDGAIMHGMDARAQKHLPGSIYWLPKELFETVLRQIVKNCHERGFTTVVAVSAHSGTAQYDTLKEVEQEDASFIGISGKEFPGGIDHAGAIETELMLAIRPDLVHLERLKQPYTALIGDDPHTARQENGIRRTTAIIEYIVQRVHENKKGS